MRSQNALVRKTDLRGLAKRIDAEHRECERSLKAGLEHALKAGQLLLEAKGAIGHGGWIAWLKKNCQVSDRLAQKYMRVARELPKLDAANTPRVADLSFREALRLTAQNASVITKSPEEDRQEILERSGTTARPMRYIAVQVKRERERARNEELVWDVDEQDEDEESPEEKVAYAALLDAKRKEIAARPEFVARAQAVETLEAKLEALQAEDEALGAKLVKVWDERSAIVRQRWDDERQLRKDIFALAEDELEIERDDLEFRQEHPGMDDAFSAFDKYLGGRKPTWGDFQVMGQLLKEADERTLAHAC
jgi:hypothetical protein